MMETFDEINNTQRRFNFEVDNLISSKRRHERISALKQLDTIFYNEFNDFSIDNLEETLKVGLKLALKGTDEEKEFALKTMIGFGLYLGTASSSLLSYFSSSLFLFFSPSVPSHLFSLALEAETTLLFVGGDIKETEEFLQFLYEYLDKSEDDLIITREILRCYSLLLSTLPPSKISNYFLPFHLERICEITREVEDISLLLTAGETIALILSSHRAHYLKENGEEMEGLEELEGFISVNELIEILETKYRSNSISNRNNNYNNLNRYLRQVYKSIIENRSPNIDSPIKIKSTLIKLNDWPRMMQMRFFREILGGSLYLHLCDNDLFAEIFDYNLFDDFSSRSHKTTNELALQRKENEKNRGNEKKIAIKQSLKSFTCSSFTNDNY